MVGTPQTEGIPQAPLREVKLLFKSGFRAPLVTPSECGTYFTHYEFTPWSGGPAAEGDVPMQITEGCDGGGFSPKLAAGSTDSKGGAFSPFTTRSPAKTANATSPASPSPCPRAWPPPSRASPIAKAPPR